MAASRLSGLKLLFALSKKRSNQVVTESEAERETKK
jgi:hypothetical protein